MPRSVVRFVLAGIVFLLAPGCSYGPRVDTFPPARQPGGIAATLYLANDSLRVEVLAVEEDALFALVNPSPPHRLAGRLAHIPYARTRDGRFEHAGGFSHSFWRYLIAFGTERVESYQATGASLAADPVARSNLRVLSRYPQGMSEELLTRLEEAYGPIETLDPGG